MAKKNSRWLQAWHKDTYVKQALHAGYRSRAAYKLAQIDARDHLFYPGITVVDLGATPGGWSQWVQQRLNNRVKLLAVDILPMTPLPNVTFIQGDFTEPSIEEQVLSELGECKADLVMSDMSPNISGVKAIDQPKVLLLAEVARGFALNTLKIDGHFLTKLFYGEGFDLYVKGLRSYFKQVVIRKPEASKNQSAEVYVLAKYYKNL